MNQSHTAIECTLSDFYAGDWVDQLDETKVQHDERAVDDIHSVRRTYALEQPVRPAMVGRIEKLLFCDMIHRERRTSRGVAHL